MQEQQLQRPSEVMKRVGGVWLPAHERHMVEWMTKRNERVDGKLTYQYHKLSAALGHCQRFRNAVDVGAHCGFWSMHLVKRFGFVHAFEPVELHRACFDQNIEAENVALYKCALGEASGRVSIATTPGSSGDSRVAKGDTVEMRRLDDFDFQEVDFLKVDCEGYELAILRGAEELLTRCRPVVCVEQKPGMPSRFGFAGRGAVSFLESLGAKARAEMSGDFILSWD